MLLMIIVILAFNYSLYYNPNFKKNTSTASTYNESVFKQLTHLKSELDQGAGEEMQSIFPEGFIFIYSLYGLSWCELIKNQPNDSDLYKKGIEEITWTINEIENHPHE